MHVNEPLDSVRGQNLEALDQTIILRGHSFLYEDGLSIFEASKATFSESKMGIFLRPFLEVFFPSLLAKCCKHAQIPW